MRHSALLSYITKKTRFAKKKRGCFIGPQNQRFRLRKECFSSKIRGKGVFFMMAYAIRIGADVLVPNLNLQWESNTLNRLRHSATRSDVKEPVKNAFG